MQKAGAISRSRWEYIKITDNSYTTFHAKAQNKSLKCTSVSINGKKL